MANEWKTDAPLAAPVRDQLEEKAHLDDAREQERKANEAVERRVERRKAGERKVAARHAAARARRRAGATQGRGRWPAWQVGVGAFLAVAIASRIVRR